jgi:AraC-like DNA-binding protein
MPFYTYTPSPPLSAFVDRFWLHEENTQPYARERALPRGSPGLWIELGGDGLRVGCQQIPGHLQTFRESVVFGAQTRWYVVEPGRRISRMGVQFRPGGASPFFGRAAGELHGMHVPLATLWGSSASAELRERLCEAPTPGARFHLLERALLTRMNLAFSRHPAVAFALDALRATAEPRTIAHVADQSGLSHRQFIRVFHDNVGMTPKQFCRLQRFLRVVTTIQQTDAVNWAKVALDSGYYDQPHLIHDFREFVGICPTAYLHDRVMHSPFYVPLSPQVSGHPASALR